MNTAATLQKILVVEDDPAQSELLADMLRQEGYEPSCCQTGRAALAQLSAERPALVLLDLGLPDEDGFALAARIRALYALPLIILSGRSAEVDRVVGLEIGADDYLTKPFSLRELAARIRAVLRRSGAGEPPAAPPPQARPELREGYRFEGWTLDTFRRRLIDPAGQPVELTVAEFDLLAVLLAAGGRILSRGQILDRTRRSHDAVYERTIDVLILRLRRKIEPDPTRPRLIVTERALGYLFGGVVEQITSGES